VPLFHFGLPRCFVTFKPPLFQVTVPYGKSLGLGAIFFDVVLLARRGTLLGGSNSANFRGKIIFFAQTNATLQSANAWPLANEADSGVTNY
jgi:hypothetical protein